jgi:hypothetical protein
MLAILGKLPVMGDFGAVGNWSAAGDAVHGAGKGGRDIGIAQPRTSRLHPGSTGHTKGQAGNHYL